MVGLVLRVWLCGASMGAVPEDVSLVRALMESAHATAAGESTEALSNALTDAVMLLSLRRLGDDVKDLEQHPRDELRASVRALVRASLEAVPRDVGPARTQALEALVRKVTGGVVSRDELEAWLGFTPAAAPTAFESRAAAQVTMTEGSGELTFVKGSAEVLDEVGTWSAGNKLIDAGEWVQLGFIVRNAGALPWFSTTATAEADSDCLYASARQLAPELEVGAEGPLALWVYVSGACTSAPSVRVRFSDTHRGETSAFNLSLAPSEVAPPRLVTLAFDTDGLGSSDGSLVDGVRAGQRFELSPNFELAPGAEPSSTRLDYRLPEGLAGLFASAQATPASLVADKLRRRLLWAGDDLDVTVVARDRYEAAVRASGLAQRWLTDVTRGRLWVAFDVTLSIPTTHTSPASGAKVLKGKHRSTAAFDEPAPAPVVAALPAPRVIELVKRFLRLSPHPVKPELLGAFSAATGYELIFDEKGFAAEYEKKAPAQPEPVSVPTATYTFRTYRSVAAPAVTAKPAPQAAVEEVPLAAAALAPTVAPEVTPTHSVVRLDLGVGTTLYGVRGEGVYLDFFNRRLTLATTTASLRAFIGRGLCGFVGASFTGAVWPSGSTQTMGEVGAEAGLGYRFFPGIFELTPWLGGDFRWRDTSLPINGGLGLAFIIGLQLAVHLTPHLSLFVDAAGRFAPAIEGSLDLGPTFNGVRLIDSSGFRGLGGASWSF